MSYVKQLSSSPLSSVTNKNVRKPKYIMESDMSKEKIDNNSIDTMSDYVKENLKKTVKPRNKEYR